MSTTLEKQVEDLHTALDESTVTIEQLNATIAEGPSAEEYQTMQQEIADAETNAAGKDAEVADIKQLAETGKSALQYAREYALGAYVSFSQCAEDSDECVEYQAELRDDDDFIGIMRAAAGYYRRSRNARAKGRQSNSEHPPAPNSTDKPKFLGRSSMGAVAS